MLLTNEDRADLGSAAVRAAAQQTGVDAAESTGTAIADVLTYIAHYCVRCGIDPKAMFDDALSSYEFDLEDDLPALHQHDARVPLVAQPSPFRDTESAR